MGLVTGSGATAVYAMAYQFAQFDPCRPTFRADWWSSGVRALLETSEGGGDEFLPLAGRQLHTTFPATILSFLQAQEIATQGHDCNSDSRSKPDFATDFGQWEQVSGQHRLIDGGNQ